MFTQSRSRPHTMLGTLTENMTPASLFLLVGAALIGSSSCHKSSLRHLQEITPPPSPGSTNNDIISPIPTPAPFLLTTSWGPTMPPVPAPTPDPTGGGPTLQTPVPTPDPTDEGPTPPPTPYPTSLPPNFEFGLVGCFSDDPNDRLLTGNSWKMDSSMTTEVRGFTSVTLSRFVTTSRDRSRTCVLLNTYK